MNITSFVLVLFVFLLLVGVVIILHIVDEDYKMKKQCRHLCSVCKYRFVCDWRNRERRTDE